MMEFFADLPPHTFWNEPFGSVALLGKVLLCLVIGLAGVYGLIVMPSRARRPVVSAFVFIGGLYYILQFLYPAPISRAPDDAPRNLAESFSFWLADSLPVVSNFSNALSAMFMGLGVYSLVHIHASKVIKTRRDWGYSLVLLLAMVVMFFAGMQDWRMKQDPHLADALKSVVNWHPVNMVSDLMFDGLLQQMDAAMFSLIAFYILSAAYRAFRLRSTEATILLATALIVMLSAMGAVEGFYDHWIADHLAGGQADSPLLNLRLISIAEWLRSTVQNPSIRGIEFGVGVGLLAMSLRIWLNLERTGETA
jgi:branched-subunit amino acid transport protein